MVCVILAKVEVSLPNKRGKDRDAALTGELLKLVFMLIHVNKADITRIGHTVYEEEGNTVFVCNPGIAGIEEILLRNILKCFGQYEILDSEDIYPNELDDSEVNIEFTTNLPWEAVVEFL